MAFLAPKQQLHQYPANQPVMSCHTESWHYLSICLEMYDLNLMLSPLDHTTSKVWHKIQSTTS